VNGAMSPEAFIELRLADSLPAQHRLVGIGILIQLRMEDTSPFRRLQQSRLRDQPPPRRWRRQAPPHRRLAPHRYSKHFVFIRE